MATKQTICIINNIKIIKILLHEKTYTLENIINLLKNNIFPI